MTTDLVPSPLLLPAFPPTADLLALWLHNPVLFPGADQDGGGWSRAFVLGKQSARKSTVDNRWYSLAAGADTLYYYYQISGCGAAVSGSARTSTIPLGTTYLNPPPADPQNPGGYAYPDLLQRNDSTYDPRTGAKIIRME